jgi:phosphatidylglycerol:prolipoprotein diacylglycerol transferase
MHQTLFHIPNQVGTLPLFGFGLLLALWAAFSILLLAWLLWRQGWTADSISYVPLLALVGAAIWLLLPALCDAEGLPIRAYGVMLLVAVTAAVGLAVWRARRVGADPDLIFALAFWMFVPGIIGARLFYVVEYWETFLRPTADRPEIGPTLGAIVNVAQGGLVVYGSFLGATLGLLAFVRKNRLPLLALCDLVAPSMMLGLALGRIGCLMNGCCFGGPCDLPWAVSFPKLSPPYESQVSRGQFFGFTISGRTQDEPVVDRVDPESPAAEAGLEQGDRLQSINGFEVQSAGEAQGILAHAFQKEQPLMIRTADGRAIDIPAVPVPERSLRAQPTQIYAAVSALLICLFLLAYDPYCRRDGQLFATLMVVYPVTRFLEEMIRTDEPAVWRTGLHISQNISLLLLVCAAVVWAYVLRQPQRAPREVGGEKRETEERRED